MSSDPVNPAAGSPSSAPGGYSPNNDERLWAMLAHLSGLLGFVISVGILAFLGPLIIWLAKKEDSQFVDFHGKEALNLQISLVIAYVACIALTVVTCGFGIVLFLIPTVYQFIFNIVAGIKANAGEYYRYPISIRFIN